MMDDDGVIWASSDTRGSKILSKKYSYAKILLWQIAVIKIYTLLSWMGSAFCIKVKANNQLHSRYFF